MIEPNSDHIVEARPESSSTGSTCGDRAAGFSTNTCFPAAMAALVISTKESCWVAITTASTPCRASNSCQLLTTKAFPAASRWALATSRSAGHQLADFSQGSHPLGTNQTATNDPSQSLVAPVHSTIPASDSLRV